MLSTAPHYLCLGPTLVKKIPMIFLQLILPWLFLNLTSCSDIDKKISSVNEVNDSTAINIVTVADATAVDSVTVTDATVANSVTVINTTEVVDIDSDRKVFTGLIETSVVYEYFSSYKLPERTDPILEDDEFMLKLKRTNELTFNNSISVNQFLRHERPGFIFLHDSLQEVCAEFRASKSSTDPSAFTNSEKFAFIERASELGMFVNIDNLKSVHKGSNQKKNDYLDNLKYRASFSVTITNSHYCRDALRIVAGVLDVSQITWLLDNSHSAILNSSEFLNQLNDFSMFQDFQLVESSKFGHYDWFKNAKALKTLKPKALLGFFDYLNYDLSSEQLELLNAARPIKELFETPEFRASAFAWQITAGTKFYLDEHLNIDALVNEIVKIPNTVELFPLHIKQAIFAFYFHSECAIFFHFNRMINITKSPKITDSDTKEDSIPVFSEEYQIEAISFHLKALEFVFTHRDMVLMATLSKMKEFKNEKDEVCLKNLVGILMSPALLIARQAVAVVEEVKKEFSNEPTEKELLFLLKQCNVFGWVYSRPVALILAFFDLKYAPLRTPYRFIPGSKPSNTLTMIYKLHYIIVKEFKEPLLSTKWPLMFLHQQALEFQASKEIQLRELADNMDIENTLDVIINKFMTICDKKILSSEFIALIKSQFPENAYETFFTVVEKLHSVEISYKKFVNQFRTNLKYFNEQRSQIDDLGSIIETMIKMDHYETRLMASIQNLFTIEMAGLLAEDTEILNNFCEFAYLLTRNQVKELLSNEAGRRLFAENRNLVHNLPTYEDFKVTDLKPLKLQAQYATMVRTMPILPLLVSLRSDDYIINDPIGLSTRLFAFKDSSFWSQKANEELINNLWRIVPIQMLNQTWKFIKPEMKRQFLFALPCILNHLKNSNEVKEKVFESIRAILHWTILQEIRYLEFFTLLNSKETEKKTDAIEILNHLSHTENFTRTYLSHDWLSKIILTPGFVDTFSFKSVKNLFEVLSGPLGQTRAAAFLTGHDIMDTNMHFVHYDKSLSGFDGWIEKVPKLPCVSAQSEVFEEFVNSTISFGNNGPTNIPTYREYIEEDTAVRREKLNRLLDQVNAILGVKADPNAQLWKDRIKMIGMLSADGFTLSPNYNTDEKLNLTVHERIIHRKLLMQAGLVDVDAFPDQYIPRVLATTVFRMAPMNELPKTADMEATVVTKKTGKQKKRK